MTLELTVSPDFSPDHIAGWYVFNTWLQRRTGERIHLELYDDFDSQRRAIAADKVDLIYANPHDAAMLVREKGFTALAAPINKPDEVVLAVPEGSPAASVEQLRPGLRLVMANDPDVNMIGMILLEPADLSRANTESRQVGSYVLVAKNLLTGKADAGFFLKDAYHNLSAVIRKQLKVLVTSEISDVRHVLMVGPRCAHLKDQLRSELLSMADPQFDSGKGVLALQALGLQGWENQDEEATEFMIDLMDTLTA
ncbi:MAG: hypothetical protein RJA44_1870 [Pseudomonadota bacterium]